MLHMRDFLNNLMCCFAPQHPQSPGPSTNSGQRSLADVKQVRGGMQSTPPCLITLKHRLAPSPLGWHVGFQSDCKSSGQGIRIRLCCRWPSTLNASGKSNPNLRSGRNRGLNSKFSQMCTNIAFKQSLCAGSAYNSGNAV